jgi:hypothetical protein
MTFYYYYRAVATGLCISIDHTVTMSLILI